jgi:hypothetical protein
MYEAIAEVGGRRVPNNPATTASEKKMHSENHSFT